VRAQRLCQDARRRRRISRSQKCHLRKVDLVVLVGAQALHDVLLVEPILLHLVKQVWVGLERLRSQRHNLRRAKEREGKILNKDKEN